MTTTTQHQVKVFCDKEEELIRVLSSKDSMEIADRLYRKFVLSHSMWDLFISLDLNNLEPQLQIRYLLRLVCKKLKEDNFVWAKFLDLLSDMGTNFDIMRKKLEKELDKVLSSIEICPLTSTVRGEEPDIILTSLEAEQLTILLAPISFKWEEVGVALRLPKHVREKCRCRDKNIISLTNIITSWLSGEANIPTNTTLHTLKEAICGPTVAEPIIAEELGQTFQPVKRPKLSLSPEDSTNNHTEVTIINQSSSTVVADGKSTLLFVQASHRNSTLYQWTKDGHVLVNNSTYTGVCDEILVISRARQGTEGEYMCCVSSEGREVNSNKIILTVKYSAAKKQLLDLYSVISEVPLDSWPPSGTRTFINLVLIKSSKEPTDITDYTVERSADKVIEEREKVEYEQVFIDCKSGELILLEGRPGSGKTTLVHKIIKDWTKGCVLKNAEWVMLITLRELNNTRAESLSDVVGYFCQGDESITKNIERSTGEGLCFVIDGLDEYQPPDKTKSPIYQLLNKALLPKAMVIVSSRPSATKNVNWKVLSKRIEILGFNREEIFQYIDNFPFSTESDITTSATCAIKLKEYLISNPNVLNMCYLPVHSAMICFLFKCKRGNIPITQTRIYEQFTCCIILRHLKRFNSEQQLECFQDLKGDSKTYFKELCYLAYEMTVKSKQVVIPQEINVQLSEKNVSEDIRYLGLVTISHIAKLSGFHSTYTFLHLTFQEFLAAVYISSLNEDGQLAIIKKYNKYHMLTVWTFYCGLVKSISKDIMHELINKFKYDTSILLHFAFESQQPTICDKVVEHELGQFRYLYLPPSLLPAFNYVISYTSIPITKLIFYSVTNDDDDVVTALLKVLQANKNNLRHLQVLMIPYISNNVQVLLLTDVLRASLNLTKVTLSFKHIDTEGMKYLADTLMSLSYLWKLNLNATNISNGITHLFSGLQHLQNTKLNLLFKDYGMNCGVELGKGLQQFTVNKVCELELTHGKIGTSGAAALGNGLFNLAKLNQLNLCNNSISDDEVNYLNVGIMSLSDLEFLNLSHNNISPSGAASLAGAIQHLNLTDLNLSNNNIGYYGASILVGAIQHRNLTHLNLSSNNIECENVTDLADAVQHLNLTHLNLSCNNIGCEGATSLAGAIQHQNLIDLDLSSSNIGSEGATTLANTLKCFKHLYRLSLSGNNINLDTAIVVVNALKNSPCHTACINKKKQDDIPEGFQVQGLVAPGDDASIATLVTAVQHNFRDRELVLGFKTIEVSCKLIEFINLRTPHLLSRGYLKK